MHDVVPLLVCHSRIRRDDHDSVDVQSVGGCSKCHEHGRRELVDIRSEQREQHVDGDRRRWQLVHRLVYAAAVLGVLHYWWHKAGKNNVTDPMIYAGVVALLLGLRLWWAVRRRVGGQRGNMRSSA